MNAPHPEPVSSIRDGVARKWPKRNRALWTVDDDFFQDGRHLNVMRKHRGKPGRRGGWSALHPPPRPTEAGSDSDPGSSRSLQILAARQKPGLRARGQPAGRSKKSPRATVAARPPLARESARCQAQCGRPAARTSLRAGSAAIQPPPQTPGCPCAKSPNPCTRTGGTSAATRIAAMGTRCSAFS